VYQGGQFGGKEADNTGYHQGRQSGKLHPCKAFKDLGWFSPLYIIRLVIPDEDMLIHVVCHVPRLTFYP